MSGRYRYDPPPRLPAQRPPRLRKRDEQAIPSAEMPPRQRDMSPSKLAELALQANPEMSNRAIAAEKGVNRMTVCRLRHSNEAYDSIERTIGRDGKSRPARRRVAQPIPRNAPAINVDLNWRAEVEEVVGPPGNGLQDVLARCSSPAAHSARRPNDRRRTPQEPGDA
jgi:hypothetical protein